MLPKVATHILHTTSRAAAAVQNQTHTFRNVLQLQSSGPSGSGPNRGSNGTGPGGAKYNAGSRFYSGYNAAGRAVTQANVITAHDGTLTQSDDNEEFVVRRSIVRTTPKRPRLRSSSLTINIQSRRERGESPGVLKAVQLHARSRHAFAPQPSSEVRASDEEPISVLPSSTDASPQRVVLRRNSISSDKSDLLITPAFPVLSVRNNSSVAPVDVKSESYPIPTSPTPARRDSTSSSDGLTSSSRLSPASSVRRNSTSTSLDSGDASPQFVELETKTHTVSEDAQIHNKLIQALKEKDPLAVANLVHQLRQIENPTVITFNAALEALFETRRPGEPLQLILETYNDMIKKSLLPNRRTYHTVINALLTREKEVHEMVRVLESRSRVSRLVGRFDLRYGDWIQEKMDNLKSEKNFESAMSLFKASVNTMGNHSPVDTYTGLMRACANHGDLRSALYIFSQFERREDLKLNPPVYAALIQVYTKLGDLGGSEQVFDECFRQAKSGAFEWNDINLVRRHLVGVCNQMIDAYFQANMPHKGVGLLEKMLNIDTGEEFKLGDMPAPGPSTFTTVIKGFCQIGDVSTAVAWFDRLLKQGVDEVGDNIFDGVKGQALKPAIGAWEYIFESLAMNGMTDDVNRLFKIYSALPHPMRSRISLLVFAVNLEQISKLDSAKANEAVKILETVYPKIIDEGNPFQITVELAAIYSSHGLYDRAFHIINELCQKNLKPSIADVRKLKRIQYVISRFYHLVDAGVERGQPNLPFAIEKKILDLLDSANTFMESTHMPYLFKSYEHAKQSGTFSYEQMTTKNWETLLDASVYSETASSSEATSVKYSKVMSVLQDMADHNITLASLDKVYVTGVLKFLNSQLTPAEIMAIMEPLGPSFVDAWQDFVHVHLQEPIVDGAASPQPLSPTSPSSDVVSYHIDHQLSSELINSLHNTFDRNAWKEAIVAHSMFMKGLEEGKIPRPEVVGTLIQTLGRHKELDKVHEVYNAAQHLVESLHRNKSWQLDAWYDIENSMVIAFAHAKEIDAAHVHRLRLLENGRAPSADAYGALILYVKDTTDDTSNALALFEESQAHGIAPNQYLYNNIISKLAKARKADYALELFQQMKSRRVQPSSITYGAVIGACARVGDAQSAETLFSEMTRAKNFKPRVPPYNTMIQLYTTTKPNRERALFYYDQLLTAGVAPTAHTYKLLMDAYGAIEPVDVTSMEHAFQQLLNDPRVDIQGTHFSALINAYGCVQKDLDKAIAVFNSIPSYPKAQPPDAVVFESIINVLVAHRRTDLIPEYITKMSDAGVHMTAYIANFLIKGYAIVGDLDQARNIFESLMDPPTGIAAPHNHAPHDPASSPTVDYMEPVYREPSTWEAMVRAELGAGNRDRALDLLERLKARQYPEAVYNRIGGIMIDHSMVLS